MTFKGIVCTWGRGDERSGSFVEGRLGHSAAPRPAVRGADGDNCWEDGDECCCMFPIVVVNHSVDPDSDTFCFTCLIHCTVTGATGVVL